MMHITWSCRTFQLIHSSQDPSQVHSLWLHCVIYSFYFVGLAIYEGRRRQEPEAGVRAYSWVMYLGTHGADVFGTIKDAGPYFGLSGEPP